MNPFESNLIPLVITVLCCGAIFYYFNMRFNELKVTVEKQNRVLTSFITNIQADIRSSDRVGRVSADKVSADKVSADVASIDKVSADKVSADKASGGGDHESDDESDDEVMDDKNFESKIINLASFENLASSEAIEIARRDKIVVSDDDDDDSEEDSDSEDDDEILISNSRNAELVFTVINEPTHSFNIPFNMPFKTFQSNSSVMEIIDLDEIQIEKSDKPVEIEEVNIEVLGEASTVEAVSDSTNVVDTSSEGTDTNVVAVSDSTNAVDTSSEGTDTNAVAVSDSTNVVAVSDSTNVVETNAADTNAQESSDEEQLADIHAYEHLKVDDLRKIATEKNLATKDEIKRFKKPELLALLKK